MQWDRKSHLETALQRHPVKRREGGALLGFFTTTEPKKRWGRKKDTSQWGFKSMPLVASQHRNRELKKKKKQPQQTNREDVAGVSPSASHILIFNQRRSSSFKPQLARNTESYKNHLPNMSRDGNTAGHQTQERHSRAQVKIQQFVFI